MKYDDGTEGGMLHDYGFSDEFIDWCEQEGWHTYTDLSVWIKVDARDDRSTHSLFTVMEQFNATSHARWQAKQNEDTATFTFRITDVPKKKLEEAFAAIQEHLDEVGVTRNILPERNNEIEINNNDMEQLQFEEVVGGIYASYTKTKITPEEFKILEADAINSKNSDEFDKLKKVKELLKEIKNQIENGHKNHN